MANSFERRKIQIFTNSEFTASLQLTLKTAKDEFMTYSLGTDGFLKLLSFPPAAFSACFLRDFLTEKPRKPCALPKAFLRRTTLSAVTGADHRGQALRPHVLTGRADTAPRARRHAQEETTNRNSSERDGCDGRTTAFVRETPARDAAILLLL